MGCGTLCHGREHLGLALRKPIEIVDKINKQEFGHQLLRKRRLHAEIEGASAEREASVPLVIIDNRLVIELRRARPRDCCRR